MVDGLVPMIWMAARPVLRIGGEASPDLRVLVGDGRGGRDEEDGEDVLEWILASVNRFFEVIALTLRRQEHSCCCCCYCYSHYGVLKASHQGQEQPQQR